MQGDLEDAVVSLHPQVLVFVAIAFKVLSFHSRLQSVRRRPYPASPKAPAAVAGSGPSARQAAPRKSNRSDGPTSSARKFTSPHVVHRRIIPMVPPYRWSLPSTDAAPQLAQVTLKFVASKAKKRDSGPAAAFPSSHASSSVIACLPWARTARS